MVFVIINWMIILLTTWTVGFAASRLARRISGVEVTDHISLIFGGLALAGAYAQYFSIVHRVSVLALSIWALVGVLSVIVWHKPMWELLTRTAAGIRRQEVIIWGVLILAVAFFTSRGSYISDTNLYHAQCVRWIEEYGVLKGLGNIQSRASYNSGFFCLTALYSMKYVFGQSMHAVQGFMALLLAGKSLRLGELFGRNHRSVQVADFARIGAVYYLSLTYREIMSPSSDFAVMIMLFFLVIRFLELVEAGVAEAAPYGLLCVLGAYTCTLKLTVGLILLIVILPVSIWIRERKVRQILIYLASGTLLVVPYLFRNVLISGWLLYPSTALDLFDVDWKVPKVLADADSFQIRYWGKGIHVYGPEEWKLWTWMPNWFMTVLTSMEKLLVIAAVLALIALMVRSVIAAVRGMTHRSVKTSSMMAPETATSDTTGPAEAAGRSVRALLLLDWALALSFLFWLFSAPLTRYGYAYLLLLPLVIFGEFYVRYLASKRMGYPAVITACCLLFIWKGAVLIRGAASEYLQPYYIAQADYDNNEGETRSYQINGITFYAGVSGYHKLPGGGITFTMRGERIEDGFIFEDKNETNIEWNE